MVAPWAQSPSPAVTTTRAAHPDHPYAIAATWRATDQQPQRRPVQADPTAVLGLRPVSVPAALFLMVIWLTPALYSSTALGGSYHNHPNNAHQSVSPAPTPPPSINHIINNNPGLPFDSLQQQLYNQQTLHHPHTILKNMSSGSASTTTTSSGGSSSTGAGSGHQVPHAAMSEMRVWLDYKLIKRGLWD